MSNRFSRKNTTQEINQQQQALSGDVLGAVTYWGLQNCRILVDDLRAAFQAEGLDEATYFPPEIAPSNAFRKAIKEVMRSHDSKGFIARPIGETKDVIVWGIVKETADKKAMQLSYSCDVQVHFKKNNEVVDVKSLTGADPKAVDIARTIKDSYFELTTTFINWDIQRMMTRNLTTEMGAVSLRRGGGFYFVAAQHIPVIEQHKRIVEGIGDCEVGMLILKKGDAHSVSSIQRDARRSLEDELNQVMEELDGFRKKTPREDTLERRVQEYQDIKSKVQMYADMLSIQVQDLHEGLDEAGEVVKKMIGQVKIEKEEKAEATKAKRAASRRKSRAAAKAEKESQNADDQHPEAQDKDQEPTSAVDETEAQLAAMKAKMEARQAQKQDTPKEDKPTSIAQIKANARSRRRRSSRVASF